MDITKTLNVTAKDLFSSDPITVKFNDMRKCTQCPAGGGYCTACGGTGIINEAKSIKVKLPKEIKEGQKVRFTVDSYADDYFYGTVTQVRNEATTTSNVVTYTVVIGIDNSDMKLKPGMTANVEIITAEEKDVMLVPNQALRFYIDDSDTAKRYKDRGVWIIKNGHPERVTVKIGVSDDDNTQILESTLKIGDEVIVSKELSAADTQKMKFRMPH